MSKICLGLGSNLGDRVQTLSEAVALLRAHADAPVKVSSVYHSLPEGFDSRNTFYNAVVLATTSRSPLDWLDFTQEVERKLGRVNKSIDKQYHDRTVDIDLLFYDAEQWDVSSPKALTLPHPEMHKRLFVLCPLAEVAPEWVHPTLGRRVVELRDGLLSNCLSHPQLMEGISIAD
ncbi:MAG: 2-amino-4-hydroxy-6-hydroxymethyldihydropteridine diphosphokinase [Porphyromonas sp.]|nr:2-amino-4-hydroxy-6-hydroxymethyldihydropteridine diphosphokinase [Porphyromonas sp.]